MRSTMLAVTAVAALSVVGCAPAGGGGGSSVVATVAGRPITAADVDAEMRVTGVSKPDDPAIRRAVLEHMIARKLSARAARDGGLTASADVRRARAMALEDFDAALDRSATLAKVAAPSDAEADAFINRHPEMFANRTVYQLDQIRTAPNPGLATLQALAPVKTMEEAEKVLGDQKVAYRRAGAVIDTLRVPTAFSTILTKLPSGAVFILPEGGGASINQVRGSEVRPVAGVGARAIAKDMLTARRRAEALRSRMATLKAGQVTYAEATAPTRK